MNTKPLITLLDQLEETAEKHLSEDADDIDFGWAEGVKFASQMMRIRISKSVLVEKE